MKERVLEINERLGQIREEVQNAKAEQIDALTKEAQDLAQERSKIEQDMKERAKTIFEEGNKMQNTTDKTKENIMEERGKALIEKRAIQLNNLNVVVPNTNDATIIPTFNQVSEIAANVKITNLQGGESFKQAYVKDYGIAGETQEGQAYTQSEPAFAYAEITKVKLTAYTEITEELKKLPSANYAQLVQDSLTVALRKKISHEILFGQGGSGHITGILTANASAITASTDIAITTINENTLDDIILSYGSQEEHSPATLILSKATLKDFAKVRGQDKKKVYTIDYRNQTIDGIPYIINSSIKNLQTAKANDYVLAYGSLDNYLLTQFSQVEILQSDDYKFKEGQVSYRISGFFGGNVVAFNGFVRVKKTA